MTDEEQKEYPDYCYMADCPMPDDGEEIFVSTKSGIVEKDECGFDDDIILIVGTIGKRIPRKDNSGETYSVVKFFNGKHQRFVEFFLDKASDMDEEDENGFMPLPAGAEDELPFK